MKILGVELFKSRDVLKQENNIVKRKLAYAQSEIDGLRPSLGLLGPSAVHNVFIPYYPMRFASLYHIMHHSDVLKNVVVSLRQEIFRRGLEIEPKFVSKCTGELCEKEFQDHKIMCDKCGSVTREPDSKQKEKVEKWIKKCNDNYQTLLEVYGSTEDDINVVDNGWVLYNKEYFVSPEGEILGAELKEIVRMNPVLMDFVSDQEGKLGYNLDGKPVFVCPVHRTTEIHHSGHCSKCGTRLFKALYVHQGYGSSKEKIYYIDGEVVHSSKYAPSLLGGFPPVLAIWQKAITLMTQDKFIRDYYGKQRPPKGLLLINTRAQESLQKAWEWLKQKAVENPHIIWPLGVQSGSTRGNVGQFINFMNNLNEMQYTESRNEMRNQIGALYGVSPIFQGDLSNSGGMNNEGLQITVTTRAAEWGQKPYNERNLPKFLDDINVTDWTLKLLPPEERDEMAELQRDSQKIANAAQMLQMGFEVEMNDDGDFEFSGEAQKPQQTEGGFGLPGVAGNTPTPKFPTATTPNASLSMGGSPEPLKKTYEEILIEKFIPSYEEKLIIKGRLPIAAKERQNLEEELDEDLKGELIKLETEIKANRKDKKTLQLKIKGLSDRFSNRVKKSTEKQLKGIYNKVLEDVEKELNLNFIFGKTDQDTINLIKNSAVFTKAFDNVSKDMTSRLNKVISNSFKDPEKFSLDKLTEEMKKQSQLSKGQLSLIARTETTKIANAARMNSYKKADEKGEFVYKWLGPGDLKTTKTCKAIKKRTDKGVPMDELTKVVEEESSKEFPDWEVNKIALAAHYGCRHLLVRSL